MRGLSDPIPAPDWMPKNLPGRLRMSEAGNVLSFNDAEMRELIQKGHLKPMGNPDPQQTKWFLTETIAQLLTNASWYERATRLAYAATAGHQKVANREKKRLAA